MGEPLLVRQAVALLPLVDPPEFCEGRFQPCEETPTTRYVAPARPRSSQRLFETLHGAERANSRPAGPQEHSMFLYVERRTEDCTRSPQARVAEQTTYAAAR